MFGIQNGENFIPQSRFIKFHVHGRLRWDPRRTLESRHLELNIKATRTTKRDEFGIIFTERSGCFPSLTFARELARKKMRCRDEVIIGRIILD